MAPSELSSVFMNEISDVLVGLSNKQNRESSKGEKNVEIFELNSSKLIERVYTCTPL